jgi:hypothetical protein
VTSAPSDRVVSIRTVVLFSVAAAQLGPFLPATTPTADVCRYDDYIQTVNTIGLNRQNSALNLVLWVAEKHRVWVTFPLTGHVLSAALRRQWYRMFGFEATQQRAVSTLTFPCPFVPCVQSCLETRGYSLASLLFYVSAELPTQITGANLTDVYKCFVSVRSLVAALHSTNLHYLNYSNHCP